MYLLDTNVISEARKGNTANPGILAFRARILTGEDFLPVQAIGEIARGIALLKHRGDVVQAVRIEDWLLEILIEYQSRILAFTAEAAQIWGMLLVPNKQNFIDKQIAAISLLYHLTLVTRNVEHFRDTGVRLLNPWSEPAGDLTPKL